VHAGRVYRDESFGVFLVRCLMFWSEAQKPGRKLRKITPSWTKSSAGILYLQYLPCLGILQYRDWRSNQQCPHYKPILIRLSVKHERGSVDGSHTCIQELASLWLLHCAIWPDVCMIACMRLCFERSCSKSYRRHD
jgi:hypothetical protein